jgi:hypothetical protein
MPNLQKLVVVFLDLPGQHPDIAVGEPAVRGKTYRIKPKFSGHIVLIDMQMRRFMSLVAEKVEPKAPPSQNGRHSISKYIDAT